MATRDHTRLEQTFIRWNAALRGRTDGYLARRPHRSFRRTYRRDYARSFTLPGYIALTRETVVLIGRNWRLFGKFFLVYSIATSIILGAVSQSNYTALTSALKSANLNMWLQTLAIFGTAVTGGLNSTSTNSNGQAFGVLLILLAWLTMIWLLRHVVAGTRVKLRDGLYGAGAPLIPTALVSLVAVVQSIPLILVAIGYSAASSTGLFAGGIETMLFVAAALLLTLLSLYWLTSTFIALIVITLPGMYPFQALRAAGDLVIGRRLRLIVRLLWLGLLVLVGWVVVLVPAILTDGWLNADWLPLVPLCVLGLTTATLILVSTYIYLLYRKLVDDEAKPA